MSQYVMPPKGLKPITAAASTSQKLAMLRQSIEQDVGQIHKVEILAVFLLADICDALGLSARERRWVLGRAGSQFVEAWRNQAIYLAGKK